MDPEAAEVRQRLTIHNRRAETTRLWLEPWGDFIEIAPDHTICVEGTGPPGYGLEFSLREVESAVYGWQGSTVVVTDSDGHELWRSPIPSL